MFATIILITTSFSVVFTRQISQPVQAKFNPYQSFMDRIMESIENMDSGENFLENYQGTDPTYTNLITQPDSDYGYLDSDSSNEPSENLSPESVGNLFTSVFANEPDLKEKSHVVKRALNLLVGKPEKRQNIDKRIRVTSVINRVP